MGSLWSADIRGKIIFHDVGITLLPSRPQFGRVIASHRVDTCHPPGEFCCSVKTLLELFDRVHDESKVEWRLCSLDRHNFVRFLALQELEKRFKGAALFGQVVVAIVMAGLNAGHAVRLQATPYF